MVGSLHHRRPCHGQKGIIARSPKKKHTHRQKQKRCCTITYLNKSKPWNIHLCKTISFFWDWHLFTNAKFWALAPAAVLLLHRPLIAGHHKEGWNSGVAAAFQQPRKRELHNSEPLLEPSFLRLFASSGSSSRGSVLLKKKNLAIYRTENLVWRKKKSTWL